MAWITITQSDVETRLTKAELTAITTAASQTAQTSAGLIASAIAAVTLEIRGYVAACAHNTLGDGSSIPDELLSASLALIRRHLFTRLPGMSSLYDDLRQAEGRDALALLRDVAACRFRIVPPTTAAADQAAGAATELISSRTRISTSTQTAGL